MNKITNSNIDEILLEFCENITIDNNEDFKDITLLFWKKMILHSGFSEIYFKFFRKIIFVYSKVLDFDISLKYFIDIVETKFLMDYNNHQSDLQKEIENEINIPKDLTQEEILNYTNNYKFNNLTIIKILLKEELLDKSIKYFIKEILFKNKKNSYDIYVWYSDNILTEEKLDIEKFINENENISLRDKYLLEDLISEDKTVINEIIIDKEKDYLSTEVTNLLEEYFFIKEIEEIVLFIVQKCDSAILKNNFSRCILEFYFSNKEEYCKEILELFKYLLNKKVLFKSNLSRGLIFLYKNWNNVKFDYPNHSIRMKNYLQFLNSEGITRGIENIFKDFSLNLVNSV